jgi:hypothetical protein
MNEAPNNQTGGTGFTDTFSSQPAPQSNPFTADLKGEFTSNFGTNTNAVSQIFKEGNFAGGSKKKYIVGGAIGVLVVLFFGLWAGGYLDGLLGEGEGGGEETEPTAENPPDSENPDESTEENTTPTPAPAPAKTDTTPKTVDTAPKVEPTAAPVATIPTTGSGAKIGKSSGASIGQSIAFSTGGKKMAIGSGKISLEGPADAASLAYDETQGPAVFTWSGGGGTIVLSRNQSLTPPVLRVPVYAQTFEFHHPWPGTWYWKVENNGGGSEVRSFTVGAPARRSMAFSAPTSGGAVSGNGGTVTWQGDGKIAYYKVELSTGGWTNPQFRFESSGNSITLSGVTAGQYQMRLGAFSEVAGRWEYSAPMPVTVQ